MAQSDTIFYQPFDGCIDDENMYVAQWGSEKVYPYKLRRI